MNAPIVVDPRRKNSSEASKMHFFLPPFFLQQAHVLKNSLGVRNKNCPVGTVSQKSRNVSGLFWVPQLPLYLRNAEVLSIQTSLSS